MASLRVVYKQQSEKSYFFVLILLVKNYSIMTNFLTRQKRRTRIIRTVLLFSFLTLPSTHSFSQHHHQPTAVFHPKTRLFTQHNYHWNRQNIAIAAPALVGMIVDPLLGLMDTVYVARVGSLELAALGACSSIFLVAFQMFRATTTATTSLVAQNKKNAPQVTAVSLLFGWWVGMAVTVALLLGGNAALHTLGVPFSSAMYRPAADYLFTRCWAAPVVLMILVAEGAFRGSGNTLVPLRASFVAACINFVLDPLLMFVGPWGVKGAAAATAFSQVGAGVVYAVELVRRKMLPRGFLQKQKNQTIITSTSKSTPKAAATTSTTAIIRTIVEANLIMLLKQGSLLLSWAYATSRATRLGATQVAAHQIAVSIWMVAALLLDGTAVSAQVLMSRAFAAKDRPQMVSLIQYMIWFALAQGVACTLLITGLDGWLPRLFTPDPAIQMELHTLMRPLAWQQLLVSLTLVLESLATGTCEFRILAAGTVVSAVWSVYQIAQQSGVTGIWMYGIASLFVGRLVTAAVASARAVVKMKRESSS